MDCSSAADYVSVIECALMTEKEAHAQTKTQLAAERASFGEGYLRFDKELKESQAETERLKAQMATQAQEIAELKSQLALAEETDADAKYRFKYIVSMLQLETHKSEITSQQLRWAEQELVRERSRAMVDEAQTKRYEAEIARLTSKVLRLKDEVEAQTTEFEAEMAKQLNSCQSKIDFLIDSECEALDKAYDEIESLKSEAKDLRSKVRSETIDEVISALVKNVTVKEVQPETLAETLAKAQNNAEAKAKAARSASKAAREMRLCRPTGEQARALLAQVETRAKEAKVQAEKARAEVEKLGAKAEAEKAQTRAQTSSTTEDEDAKANFAAILRSSIEKHVQSEKTEPQTEPEDTFELRSKAKLAALLKRTVEKQAEKDKAQSEKAETEAQSSSELSLEDRFKAALMVNSQGGDETKDQSEDKTKTEFKA